MKARVSISLTSGKVEYCPQRATASSTPCKSLTRCNQETSTDHSSRRRRSPRACEASACCSSSASRTSPCACSRPRRRVPSTSTRLHCAQWEARRRWRLLAVLSPTSPPPPPSPHGSWPLAQDKQRTSPCRHLPLQPRPAQCRPPATVPTCSIRRCARRGSEPGTTPSCPHAASGCRRRGPSGARRIATAAGCATLRQACAPAVLDTTAARAARSTLARATAARTTGCGTAATARESVTSTPDSAGARAGCVCGQWARAAQP